MGPLSHDYCSSVVAVYRDLRVFVVPVYPYVRPGPLCSVFSLQCLWFYDFEIRSSSGDPSVSYDLSIMWFLYNYGIEVPDVWVVLYSILNS